MITNVEARESASVANSLLNIILIAPSGQARRKEQVKLIANLIQAVVEACTVPTTMSENIAIAIGSIK